jgi:hypothetical protein
MFAGHLMTGGSVSTTVTVNEHVLVTPEDSSVAVQVTVLVPTEKKEPEGGLQDADIPGQFLTLGGG